MPDKLWIYYCIRRDSYDVMDQRKCGNCLMYGNAGLVRHWLESRGYKLNTDDLPITATR